MAYQSQNTNGQKTKANSSPVTMASDQTPIVDISSTGTLTAAAQTVVLALNGQSAGTAAITGTWVGTITWEGTIDGTNFFSINAVSASTSAPQSTTTANGLYRITPGGLTQIRANMSAFTSGTATVKFNASVGVGGTFVNQILPAKITDGTNIVTIKAASTAAVATDPAFVVAISPNNTLPVSGTFFQATQPVSIVSVPSHAVTNAGTFAIQQTTATSSGNTTIQNAVAVTGNGTSLIVTGYGVAMVSITGTFVATVNFEASTDAGVNWTAIAATVIGASDIMTSTTTTGLYRIACAGIDLIRARVTWTSGTSLTAIGSATNAVLSNKTVKLATGVNVIGALTANQSVNTTQINGVALSVGNGITGTGSQRVTISSDNTAFAVNNTQQGTASQNIAQVNAVTVLTGTGSTGTGSQRVTVAVDSATIAGSATLPAGTNLIGKVSIDQTTPGTTNAVQVIPGTTGGLTTFHLVSAATTNATNIKASAGQVFGYYIYNSNAAARKVAFHNTAGTPTAGASIFYSLVIPPSAGANVFSSVGIAFATGIAITTVTGLTDADATAVALNDLIINIYYK